MRTGLVKVSTITVARPTAAEQTMQPASISENSRRSVAACINCRAQATRAITTTTTTSAITVNTEVGSSRKGFTDAPRSTKIF